MPQLAPPMVFRAVGSDGLALVGGKLYSYLAGTSTPKATYTDYTLASSNTNPVILDSRGEAAVWLDGSYKLRLLDAADNLIREVDDVRDLTTNQTFTGATLAGSLTVTSTTVTWSGDPTHSGNHTFTNNVAIDGNATLGDAPTDTVVVNADTIDFANDVTITGEVEFADPVELAGATVLSGATTLSGASTFSAVATFSAPPHFTALPTGLVTSASAAVPLMAVTNGSVSTPRLSWSRVGDFVEGRLTGVITPSAAAGAEVSIGFVLPVSSSFTQTWQLAGVINVAGNLGDVMAGAAADTDNARGVATFYSGSTTPRSFMVIFSYQVI